MYQFDFKEYINKMTFIDKNKTLRRLNQGEQLQQF